MRVSHQLLVSVAGGSGPLYLQIYHRLRRLILEGAWPEGTRLPSSRSIAQDLGMSRNTALLAIEKLMADGWIVARAGSGIYVSYETPPARRPSALASTGREEEGEEENPRTLVPFEIAHGAVDIFPAKAWSKIQNKIWSDLPADALLEGKGGGWPALQREIAAYLYAVRGLPCSPEQVLIVPSTQAAIDLTLRVLAEPDDGIWVEDPGYQQAREAFRQHHLRQHPLTVDAQGIDVPAGLAQARDARFAYVTPACQFPSCQVLSPSRRAELLDWANDRGSYIIEDDWDFNATFDEHYPSEPLAASDRERVIFIHAFNRILFPSLRVTALVVPPALVGRFLKARQAIDGFANVPTQIALTEFIRQGLLSAHLRRCRSVYAERRNCLHQLIEEHLGPWIEVDRARGGLHAIAKTDWIQDSELASLANQSGVACLGLSDFLVEPACDRGALILGFGAFAPPMLEQAIGRLAAVIRQAV